MIKLVLVRHGDQEAIAAKMNAVANYGNKR